MQVDSERQNAVRAATNEWENEGGAVIETTDPATAHVSLAHITQRNILLDFAVNLRRVLPSKKKDNSMEPQETDLERRVLAHARILQALIRHLAEDSPEVLARLQAAFGPCHTLGEYEQDYSSTEQYGQVFVRAIEQDIAKSQ